jgi:hypothetical protein
VRGGRKRQYKQVPISGGGRSLHEKLDGAAENAPMRYTGKEARMQGDGLAGARFDALVRSGLAPVLIRKLLEIFDLGE